MTDVDLLIVGSGIAGLAAANAAWEAGARRILIAESEGVVGGSSRLSGGIIMGAGTRYQAAAGIADDADALFHDYLSLNRWQVDVGVVRRYADEVGPTVDWLGDLGVEFFPDLVYAGGERVPRCVCAVGNGQGVIDAMHRTARERGVDIALGRRVDRLLVADGAVRGVAVGDDEITAHAVLLATGGFGANPERMAELYPSAAATGDWLWYIGAEGARGDGLDLAAPLGAQLTGFDRGLRLLHPNFVRTLEAYLPTWIVLVDRDGRRFVDETAPYGLMDGLVKWRGDVVHAVFDDAVVHPERAPATKYYKQDLPGRTGRGSPNWNPTMVTEMVDAGRVHRADTVEELAAAMGVPPTHLAGTIARYNAGAEGAGDEMGKAPGYLRPLVTPPFYAAELRPATVCLTSCGLRIDADARVLDAAGRAVPGLYAAGETTGGVLGDIYVGSGNSLSNGATFGRIAGRHAASLVPSA